MKDSPAPSESWNEAKSLIALDRYPVDRQDSDEYVGFVGKCRENLRLKGACVLPDFITPGATFRMADETDRIVNQAYKCIDDHNPYLDNDDPSWPVDHPRRRQQKTDLDVLAYDLLADSDALHQLYNWEPLVDFVADVVSKPRLYRMADPLAALTVNVMHEGQHQGWHFDEAEITTSIMLRAPLYGGKFQYAAHLRTSDDARYEDVDRVLAGTHLDTTKTLAVKPGTMVIFAGHYAMHRVTTVVGKQTRYVAILCFKDAPDIKNSPEVQKLFYGRTSE